MTPDIPGWPRSPGWKWNAHLEHLFDLLESLEHRWKQSKLEGGDIRLENWASPLSRGRGRNVPLDPASEPIRNNSHQNSPKRSTGPKPRMSWYVMSMSFYTKPHSLYVYACLCPSTRRCVFMLRGPNNHQHGSNMHCHALAFYLDGANKNHRRFIQGSDKSEMVDDVGRRLKREIHIWLCNITYDSLCCCTVRHMLENVGIGNDVG